MKTAFLGLKETWASRVIGGRSARPVPGEKMALKARRVAEVPMVIPVLWGPLGRRENSESQGYQGTQEDKDQRALLDSLDFLAPMERRAAGGPLESRDRGGSEAQRVQGVKEAPGASLGNLAPRATLEVTAQLALLVNGDPTDPKDPRDFLDQRAPLALQARMDSRGTLDREARLVSKARLALQAPQAWSALRVPREKRAQWVSVATLGPLDPPVNRGFRALLEKKGRRVTQAPQASLGKMALQDYVVSLGTEGFLVQWELLD